MKEGSKTLAETLLERREMKLQHLTLSETAPVLSFLPPFLLKETMAAPTQPPRFHFRFFKDKADLPAGVNLLRGHPASVYQFLVGTDDIYLDFDQLGVAHLSRSTMVDENQDLRMRLWLDYALSPELWGPEGKWATFHDRLHKLFEKHNLLDRPPVPGYYPLKSEARSWEKYPLRGDRKEGSFDLVLPWTFSLTDLQRLEELINEEN
ncbi:MAG: hypothetical protein ACJ76H_02145 [Bacteriovoracaceae bacterium]